MKRKTWPLVLGVILVGALAGLALGGRPTTLPAVQIPPATTAAAPATAATQPPATAAPTAAPTTTPTTTPTTAASTSTAPSSTAGG